MPALGKAERLYRRRTVSALFAHGRRLRISGGAYMLKVFVWLCDPAAFGESPESVKVMFSAPKSSFRHAVDRNRMKRLMREGFRGRKAVWEALSAQAEAMAAGADVVAGSGAGTAGSDVMAAGPDVAIGSDVTAGSGAGAGTSGKRKTLLLAFVFTKIGKPAAGDTLKQADMQGYMDRAADKLGRILTNEGGLDKR